MLGLGPLTIDVVDAPESETFRGCVICLPGRGSSGKTMARTYRSTNLNESVIIGMSPNPQISSKKVWTVGEWYPAPNGPDNQAKAVDGLEEAAKMVLEVTDYVNSSMKVADSNLKLRKVTGPIVLAGFSAGAVTALYTATRHQDKFAGVVCHSGALLEPENLPQSTNEMPILVVHYEDDAVFGWEQRYLPMKKALVEKGYNVIFVERKFGGHGIMDEDLQAAGIFLAHLLGYPEGELC